MYKLKFKKKVDSIRNKKGVMDDFTDLLSFVLIIFMLSFFAAVVLRTDTGEKTDQTLARIESFRGQEDLLDLVSSPALIGNKEVDMKEVIFSAVNNEDESFFSEKMQAYFQGRQIEGGVAVYDSLSYGSEEEPEPMLSYNNVVFLGKEKGALYLTNYEGKGNKRLILVKLFG